MPTYKFITYVNCDQEEQALQVLGERLGYSEDYGFEYSVWYQKEGN